MRRSIAGAPEPQRLNDEKREGCSMAKLLKDTFRAWIDRMPGRQPRLIVTGDIEVPTSAWTASLERAVPQDINENILLLTLVARPPSGMANQVISTLHLRYEESPPQRKYTQVTVSDGRDSVTVDVGATQ
jgi:hypothetical protein